jgi:hypothetical protein
MKHSLLVLTVLVLVAVLLSACSGEPKAAPTFTPAPSATETARPSETPVPTNTQTPVPPSATATPVPSATPTVLPSETPRPTFAGFQVQYSEFTAYGLTLSFRIPGVKDVYRLLVNKAEFKCQLNSKTPDTLFCYGQQFSVGQTVSLTFLPPEKGDTVVYQTSYKIAPLKTPTPDARTLGAQNAGACEQRGKNPRCETEYRNDGKGYYCIVSTCFDVCGLWYSIDTCPPGSDHNGIYIFTGTPPLPPNH